MSTRGTPVAEGYRPVSNARHQPLHAQVAANLRERIDSRELPPETRLPGEPELCDLYKVSRITVRHAIRSLVDEGYLYVVHGRGTYVKDRRLTAGFRGAASFSEEMAAIQRSAGSKILAIRTLPATEKLARPLSVETGSLLISVRRIRTGDDLVVGIQETFIPEALTPELSRYMADDVSLYAVLEERYDLVITEAEELLEVRGVTLDEASLLDVTAGTPAFAVTRVGNSHGHPVELTKSVMRGDRYQVRLALRRA